MKPNSVWRRNEIQSPCINICQIHPSTRLCLGCHRTIDEISDWSKYTDAERAEIIEALPERQAAPRTRRGGRASRV